VFASAYEKQPSAETAAAEGAAALLAGDVDGAIARLDAAATAHPDSDLVKADRALAHFARLEAALADGQPKAADLRAALDAEDKLSPLAAARVRYAGLVLALRAGDPGSARAHFGQLEAHLAEARKAAPDARAFAASAPPQHLEYLAAYTDFLARRYDQAYGTLAALRAKAKKGGPEQRLAALNAAHLAEKRWEAGDPNGAGALWKEASDLDRDPALEHNLAVVDWAQGRKKKAEQRWRALGGQVAEASFNLGVAAEAAGKPAEAYEQFARYAKSNGAHAAQAREIVEAMRRIFGFEP
jgi:hypothetical protein